MKRTFLAGLACLAVAVAVNAQQGTGAPQKADQKAGAPQKNSSELEGNARTSYAVGFDIGNRFRTQLEAQGIDIDSEMFLQGMRAALTGSQALLTEEQVAEAIQALDAEMRTRQEARQKELTAKNRAAGEAFLAANRSKEGVVQLPSGLQYKVITDGTGPVPKASDTVVVHYRGTTVEGEQFDSSYDRGTPATLPVSGVIKGWTEALQLMKVGSKWQLFIPPDLAYGERSPSPKIGPASVLVFDVELVGIVPPKGAPGATPPTAPTQPTAAPQPTPTGQ